MHVCVHLNHKLGIQPSCNVEVVEHKKSRYLIQPLKGYNHIIWIFTTLLKNHPLKNTKIFMVLSFKKLWKKILPQLLMNIIFCLMYDIMTTFIIIIIMEYIKLQSGTKYFKEESVLN